jgi:hypothetical protein
MKKITRHLKKEELYQIARKLFDDNQRLMNNFHEAQIDMLSMARSLRFTLNNFSPNFEDFDDEDYVIDELPVNHLKKEGKKEKSRIEIQ